MLFQVLGPLQVEVDGVPAAVPGARPRALLTALLLQPNTLVAADQLIEALWGEQPPEHAANALHRVMARLRATLGDAGTTIVTRPPGYLLAVDASMVDATRFESLYRAARARLRDDAADANRLLDEALALWRGPAYGEFADGFARPAATRLEELRLAALEDRAALLLRRGAAAEAIATAGDLAARQPLRERPVEVLMRALHATGRTAEALEAYRRHRQLIASELGLEPGAGLRELETRVLRDDLPPAAADDRIPPAVGATVLPSHDLPWRPSPMVGRDDELAALIGTVSTRRLVTLVGPGGVGKTRLALEAAHRLAASGHVVWWADLIAVSANRVIDALADATGTEPSRTRDPARALCAALAGHRGALFIDNAEHVLAVLAPFVERLIDAAPELTIVVTSRERLALDHESLRILAPLPVPKGADLTNPAVRLFLDRAPGLEPDDLPDDGIAAVARLCRGLDGLPLAIELGAARTVTFGVHELAAHLGERLDLLAGGRRTAAARHRTLRAVVDWSHELLTGDEARLFARLAVFAGAFRLDQAEAVCSDDHLPRRVIAGLVARLVEQSLVQAGRGRFWLLETLRVYASEQLDAAGETAALRQRHANDTAQRLAALDQQLWTSEEPAAVAALTELVADLHAVWAHARRHDRSLAMQLAGDVYDFAYLRQRLDLLAWGSQAASWNINHPRRAKALAAAAADAWAGGRLDDAWAHATAAGDQHPSAGRAVSQTGNLAMFKGRTDDAMARFRAAADVHRAGGEHTRALMDDISVEQARTYGGHQAIARNRMADLVAQAHRTDNPTALCWSYYILGEATADADFERAMASYTTAIDHGRQTDCKLLVMLARSSSIALTAHSGPTPRALHELQRLLDQWEQLGNELVQWWVLLHLVVALAGVPADTDAAVIAGAVLAARDRQPQFATDTQHLTAALTSIRNRLGTPATDDALATGRALSKAAAIAYARTAIKTARELPA